MESPLQTELPNSPSDELSIQAKPAWKELVQKHPTALIIGSFILLPFLIFGVVLLGLKAKNGSSSSIIPTPTPTPTVFVSATTTPKSSPTLAPNDDTFLESETTPTKKPTAKPTQATVSTSTPAPTATTTPTKQANLYFHFVDCTYTPIASGSAALKLDGATVEASTIPDTALCHVIFQNSEDVETGDIWYRISSDSDKSERVVGKLKKGNYPNSEFKEFQEVVNVKKTTGSHEIRFEINYAKLFPEVSYDDNTKVVKYTVQ